jgi:hypothetical protein
MEREEQQSERLEEKRRISVDLGPVQMQSERIFWFCVVVAELLRWGRDRMKTRVEGGSSTRRDSQREVDFVFALTVYFPIRVQDT